MQTLYQRAFVAVAAAAASPWSLELKRVAAALTGSVERHHAGCLAGGEAMRTLRWQQRLPFTTKRLSGQGGSGDFIKILQPDPRFGARVWRFFVRVWRRIVRVWSKSLAFSVRILGFPLRFSVQRSVLLG
jgi:hypothetical protein